MNKIKQGIAVNLLIFVLIGCNGRQEDAKNETAAPEPLSHIETTDTQMGSEYTFQIRVPGDSTRWILVTLDSTRLHDLNLSKKNIMNAATATRLVSFKEVSHPDVVYDDKLYTVGEYEQLVVSADPSGRVIRLKDVGKIELMQSDVSSMPRIESPKDSQHR